MQVHRALPVLVSVAALLGCQRQERTDDAAPSSPTSAASAPAAASPASPPSAAPSAMPRPPTRVARIAAGSQQTFAILSDGSVFAWGSNAEGKLGLDSKSAKIATPTRVQALSDVVWISTTFEHSCAVTKSGEVLCFGRNFAGSLGRGKAPKTRAPAPVAGVRDAISVESSRRRSCALMRDGTVTCWGIVAENQSMSGPPQAIAKVDDVVQIAVFGNAACGRRRDGSVVFWDLMLGKTWAYGAAVDGQFDNVITSGARVKNVADSVSVSLGERFCSVATSGAVACFGASDFGGFGDAGVGFYFLRPRTPKAVPPLLSVVTRPDLTCGITRSSQVVCWGDNSAGELGLGDQKPRAEPSVVPGLSDVEQIALGDHHACALTRGGTLSCWGRNAAGQLGTGESSANARRATPAVVTIPLTQ